MSKQITTTTVREYDEEGRVVKETVTVYEYDWTPSVYYQPPYQSPPWYQSPYIISHKATQ